MELPLRLSPSRISDFNNCPQHYKYRVVDKLPEPPSIDAERGTLVHTVLHDLFESPAAERTPEKAIELLPSRWIEQLEGKPELSTMITNEKEWLDRASALLRVYFDLEDPSSFEATHRELHLENETGMGRESPFPVTRLRTPILEEQRSTNATTAIDLSR